jgi:hypothetical protein
MNYIKKYFWRIETKLARHMRMNYHRHDYKICENWLVFVVYYKTDLTQF